MNRRSRLAGYRRIGLMGGSFNPPHRAHLDIARLARKAARLDEVWWLVSPQNPLKNSTGMAAHQLRLAASRQLAGWHPWLKVPDIETGPHRSGHLVRPAYTADLLENLRKMRPRSRFVWIMGADNLVQFHRWFQPRRIARLADILVLNRPGFTAAALAGRGPACLGQRTIPARLGRGGKNRWAFIHASRNPLSASALRAGGQGL